MSKRLEIFKNSLVKKEQQLNAKFDEHFSTVKRANGQPLNDKRNNSTGAADKICKNLQSY